MLTFDKKNARTWSMLGACGAFGLAALDLAEEDKDNNLAVLTADLAFFSGLERFRASYPEKLYNIGIAEQNMVGIAGGMANEGMNVFATTYASFASTRVMDQVKVNMGYMKFPIKLIGLTSGYSVGILGATHMATEDIAIMKAIPHVTVLSPADCTETVKCVLAAAKLDSPVYIRLTGTQRVPIVFSEDYDFEIGKGITLREGKDVAIFATGPMVNESLKAAKTLEEEGIDCAVIDIHTIKPIDEEIIKKHTSAKLIVAAEEHSIIGGLGSSVADVLSSIGNTPRLIKVGIEDDYQHAADYDTLMMRSNLNAERIVKDIKANL